MNISGKFSLKDTVINIVAGLGLISFITMFCDFIMLNYVSERKIVGFSILRIEPYALCVLNNNNIIEISKIFR